MTPLFSNPSSNNCSPYPTDDHFQDHLTTHQFFSTNSQTSSSSKPLTPHMFLNSNDQNGVFNRELQHPQYQHEGDNFGLESYTNHGIENNNMNNDLHQVRWMSSKMRVMLKIKKSNNHPMSSSSTSREVVKLEEHKPSSSIEETDNSSNSTTSSNNNLIPIRVCSDCNTTKTPLWRGGPQGPKSLCNACGIRQRKARKAAAAAAAFVAVENSCVFNDPPPVVTQLKVIKTQHKDHKKPSKGHVTKYKKRQYSKQQITTTPPPSSPPSCPPARKNRVEDFLANLSKNLTFYHVLPQDEKEAAILLMALSCGYAHET
ncbi:hypothetical protein SSX86_021515 [Deinandra increscens subsp. villosa]|uniref:GATA-type domain-containing protein n=1 Tax=Deinandra increscens subsp. villosa TaxID=3103831 RepID=A0AAP0GUD9_9ASTR